MEEKTGFLEAFIFGVEQQGDAEDADLGERFWGVATGINWCEQDYEVSPYIAEFWNTISNLGFVLVGIHGLVIAKRLKLPWRFTALSLSILGTGLTSGFFHMTLWWSGQKADESFENVALIMLYHADSERQSIALLQSALVTLGIFFVSFILICEIHLISIIILALRKTYKLSNEVEQETMGQSGLRKGLSMAAAASSLGALCWVIDRLACNQVRRLAFNPQLHMWWHLFCAVALQHAVALSVGYYRWQLLQDKKGDDIQLPLIRVNRVYLAEINA